MTDLEESIKSAYNESANGTRKGDTFRELEEIKTYLLKSDKIVVPNWNEDKISAINEVLEEFGLCRASHLQFHTNCCDLTRMPVITKALMALDVSHCDIVIARGRLGVPGSGSMLVIIDKKGRILSAALSSAHILHEKTVNEAVRDEMTEALLRIGLSRRE
jgi:hypothetical protein